MSVSLVIFTTVVDQRLVDVVQARIGSAGEDQVEPRRFAEVATTASWKSFRIEAASALTWHGLVHAEHVAGRRREPVPLAWHRR